MAADGWRRNGLIPREASTIRIPLVYNPHAEQAAGSRVKVLMKQQQPIAFPFDPSVPRDDRDGFTRVTCRMLHVPLAARRVRSWTVGFSHRGLWKLDHRERKRCISVMSSTTSIPILRRYSLAGVSKKISSVLQRSSASPLIVVCITMIAFTSALGPLTGE